MTLRHRTPHGRWVLIGRAPGAKPVSGASLPPSDALMPTLATVGHKIPLTPHNGDWRTSTQGSPAGRDVSGVVYLDSANTVLEDFKAHTLAFNCAPGGNYYWPVRGGQTIKNATIGFMGGVGCLDVTMDRCDIGNVRGTFAQLNDYFQDGKLYPCRNFTITNSIFHNLTGTGSGDGHFEAFHPMGMDGALIKNCVMEFGTTDPGTKAQITAVVFFDGGNGTDQPCRNIVIEDLWLYGGGYYQAYLAMIGTSITRLRFHRLEGTSAQAAPTPDAEAFFEQEGCSESDGVFEGPETNTLPIILETSWGGGS